MPKTHPPYPPEFRRRMVELVWAGRSPSELAKVFKPSAQAIRTWVEQAGRDDGRRADGLTSAEREELQRLQREVRRLRQERDILAKAAAVDRGPQPRSTARETDSTPSGSSSS